MSAHEAIEVPKECCWHVVKTLRSWPPVRFVRCCWCKTERRESTDVDKKHGPYA